MKNLQNDRFLRIKIAIVLASIILAGLSSRVLLSKNKHALTGADGRLNITHNETEKPPITANQSVDDKYLVIKEWGVQLSLPPNLKDSIAYSLGDMETDPDGNQLQYAEILVAKKALSANSCATVPSTLGDSVSTGAQYIRSEASKPFNARRYRATFKENILTNGAHSYHLSYTTPDCVATSDMAKIQELQTALANLRL